MKAFLYNQYGNADVLQYKEIAKPIPNSKEVLIRIHASTVSAGVIWMRKGRCPNSKLASFLLRMYLGFSRPKINILGVEFAGVVESVGKDVHYFKKGDKIFGTTTGLKHGTYADYVCLPEQGKQNVIARIPDGLSFEEAAALPVGGMAALCILNKAKLRAGQKILIYGASGSVGTYAVQIAKYYGAHVIAVCSNRNLQLVQSLGADLAFDYTLNANIFTNEKYDLVFDAVGKIPKLYIKLLLNSKGKFYSINTTTDEKLSYLHQLLNMIAEQKLKVVIDRFYSFIQLAAAHEYVEQGRKRGNVVICH